MLPRLQIEHRSTETWREATEKWGLYPRDEVHDGEEEGEASSQVVRKRYMSTHWQLAFGLGSDGLWEDTRRIRVRGMC